jgi:carboxylesterase type B
MPAKDLEAAAEKHPELIDGDAYVDGWFLPEDVNAIFSKGKENAVSLLTGAMNDEHGIAQNLYRWRPLLTVWVHPPKTKAEYLAWARDSFGEDAERLLKVYPANSDTEVAQAIHDIGRDSILQGQRVWTQFQSKDGRASAYLYNFSHKPPVPSTPGTQEPIIGAIHGAEFYYTFDNLHVKDLPWTDTDRRVADSASSYWTNFAKTGDPNGPGLPHWQAYNSKYDLLMNIGDTPHAEPVQNKAGLDFLSWWDQHFRANQGKGN